MPDSDATTERDSADERSVPAPSDAVLATESYKTEEGVVFYDAQNPLAWMQAEAVLNLEELA